MQKHFKRGICVFLCFILALGMTACSGARAMTEANITKTVELVEKALREFDQETLKSYVSSKTLNYILTLAKGHEQFAKLGEAMFEKLEIEVKEVDTKNQTVTISVKNRDMKNIASEFAEELTDGRSTLELLALLQNDEFLDVSLGELTSEISEAIVPDNPTEVTLKVEKGEKNLVLVFDEDSEDAVSGGALTAITNTVTSGFGL